MSLLIVGLWRSPWAVASSVKTQRLSHSPVMISTSQWVTCTRRSCCGVYNVSEDILHYFPHANIVYDEESTTFMRRLEVALWTFEPAIRTLPWLLVLRPDAELSRPVPTHKVGLGIIPGNLKRRYYFSNRDWDFGYIVNPLSALKHWVCCYKNHTLPESQPRLPTGLDGIWTRHNRNGVYENSIVQLATLETPVYGLDAHNVVLSLRRCAHSKIPTHASSHRPAPTIGGASR